MRRRTAAVVALIGGVAAAQALRRRPAAAPASPAPTPPAPARPPVERPAIVWEDDAEGVAPRRRLLVVRRLARQPVTVAAVVVLVGLFVIGALAPHLYPNGPGNLDLTGAWFNHGPTLKKFRIFGTDNIGRDILARSIFGLRATETTALLGALAATVLGILLGGVSGFYRGWVDAVVMRIVDLVSAFPAIVLMLGAFVLLAPVSTWEATAVFAAYMSTAVARVVRARFTVLGGEEFVEAARALGASDARIFLRHLLPNAAGAVVVAATSMVGQIVLLEATVEFFGYGVNSTVHVTLGNLLADATQSGIGAYSTLGLGWWVWGGPAIVLVLILVCTNLAGDGLDAALNPRRR